MEKLSNLKNVKGVIFDFDGTIFDLKIDWKHLKGTLSDKFASFGYTSNFTPLYPELNRLISVVQRDFNSSLAKKMELESLNLIKHYELEGMKNGKIKPFAARLLFLLKTSKIAVGIVSSNCKTVIYKTITENNLPVTTIIGREDVSKVKPDIEPINLCLKRMNLKSDDVIGVGNSKEDVNAYREAGIAYIFLLSSDILYPYEDPVAQIKSLEQICHWIKSN